MDETRPGTAAPPPPPRLDERSRFVWKGGPKAPLSDLYHAWLDAPWRQVVPAVLGFYLAVNLVFGLGYWLAGGIENARAGSFTDAFFFSVQTFATIGYGKMVPVSAAANLLVTVEALCSMLASAIVTGMLFAKFARPTARVRFSEVMVVAGFEGRPSLQFRVANERANRIVEATLRLSLLRGQRTQEGVFIRRIHDLTLLRERTAIFALTLLAVHRIDEQSPLFGLTPERAAEEQLEFIVSISGLDETYAQTIHARRMYRWDELRFGHRFADIVTELPDGRREIDYQRFHATLPEAG